MTPLIAALVAEGRHLATELSRFSAPTAAPAEKRRRSKKQVTKIF
jgi:hypothetical protein